MTQKIDGKILEEFKKIGKYLFQEGLVGGHGGDMSIRQEDRIFITADGALLFDLEEKDIIEVAMQASEKDAFASHELIVHREIYSKNNALAIIHAHPVNAIAISITDNKIVPQDATGLKVIKSAPIVRAHESIASADIARLIPSFLTNGNVVAMVKGHGSFAVAADLMTAYRYTSILENSCKILSVLRATQIKSAPVEQQKRSFRSNALPPALGVMDRQRNRFSK